MKKNFLACFLACFAVCGATSAVSLPDTTTSVAYSIELPPLTEYLEVDAPETIYGKVGETIEINYGYRDIFSSSGFNYTPHLGYSVSIDYSKEELLDYTYFNTYNCINLIFNETGSNTITVSFSDDYNGAGGTVKKEFHITITDAEESTTTTATATTTTTETTTTTTEETTTTTTEETTTTTTEETTTTTEETTTTTEETTTTITEETTTAITEETTTTTTEETTTTTTEETTTTTTEETTTTITEETTTAITEETTTTTTEETTTTSPIEELPETGYSKWYNILALTATGMTITGTAFILRKKDKE